MDIRQDLLRYFPKLLNLEQIQRITVTAIRSRHEDTEHEKPTPLVTTAAYERNK